MFQYIQQQIAAQDRLMASQDSRLDMMSETMGTLRNVSGAIGQELDEQAVMLDEFGTEIENAESKLDATMRKMVSQIWSLTPFYSVGVSRFGVKKCVFKIIF